MTAPDVPSVPRRRPTAPSALPPRPWEARDSRVLDASGAELFLVHNVGHWEQDVVARWLVSLVNAAGPARTDARLDEAAAALCAAWIDATLILPAGVGKHAQFAALTEDGRDVWRELVGVVAPALGPDPIETGIEAQSLRDGIAYWLSEHHGAEWDELGTDDRAEYRTYADALIRFVQEPLMELSCGQPSVGPGFAMSDSDCVFCVIANESPSRWVGEWPDAIAIEPLNPVVLGHTLIIPREHVADATTNEELTASVMVRAAEFARRYEASNIITSVGAAATQSIFHLHVHVVPRTVGDQLMVPWGTLHGENPQDPHRCKDMVALEAELGQLERANFDMARTLRVMVKAELPPPAGLWATSGRTASTIWSRCTGMTMAEYPNLDLPVPDPRDDDGERGERRFGDEAIALLREAEAALRSVGKAALVVKTTLDVPYPDSPETTPWRQFMAQPAREAYNLGCRIHRELRDAERRDGP